MPDPLLGPLLEEIYDLAELKVTLRGLWLLHRKRGFPRAVSLAELLNDRVLLRGLSIPGGDPRAEVRRGLHLAVARKTLLRYQPAPESPDQELYLLNTDSDRRSLVRLEQGQASPGSRPLAPGQENGGEIPPSALSQRHVLSEAERGVKGNSPANIFALYEDNVGLLSPILVEELKEAEKRYPWSWISEAFKIAVSENKRSWRYISGILRRWAAEGKDHGEPGRYSKEDDRQKYLEDYRRRRGRLPQQRADG